MLYFRLSPFYLWLVLYWQTARRKIDLTHPLVMGILNLTPDSFSDGGKYGDVDSALRHVEKMIADGAEVIDVGGESTRPGSCQIDPGVEMARTVPVVAAIATRFDIPIAIDTTKSAVARANIDAGAEIVNDIAALRWDPEIGIAAAAAGAGLILMHSRGSFETMHSEPPVTDIIQEVRTSLAAAVKPAKECGLADEQIVLDIGLGFGKTQGQNVELLAKIGELSLDYPILVGASRKSFIGRLAGAEDPSDRLAGSIAAAVLAVTNGAKIVRVHDVRETVHALKVAEAIANAR